MKITCTQEEKDRIILLVINSPSCVFDSKRFEFCKNYRLCKQCLEDHVKWEVTDDG